MNLIKQSVLYGQLRSICFLLLLLALFATSGYAQDFSKRAYLTGGLGSTLVEPESSTDALTISDDSDVGAHLGLGVDINRLLSLEVYAASLGEAGVEFLGADAGTIDYTVFGYSVLGYLFNSQSGFVAGDQSTSGLFRREGLSLYGRVGVGHLQNDSSTVNYRRINPNHLTVGVGLEYGWENGFALRTEFTSFDTDAKYFNIGLVKRFGSAASLAAPALAAAIEKPATKVAESVVAEVTTQRMFKPIVPPYIYFMTDKADLTSETTSKLDEFIDQFAGNDLRLMIHGHADAIASESYNLRLSVRRAEAVESYLVSKGLDRSKIETLGFGETQPIDANDTEDGRSLNRRVDIVLRN